jgi:hypothetical protein
MHRHFFVVVMSPTLFCGCNDTDIFCGYDDTDTLCGCSETRFYINICLCVFSSDPQTYFFLNKMTCCLRKWKVYELEPDTQSYIYIISLQPQKVSVSLQPQKMLVSLQPQKSVGVIMTTNVDAYVSQINCRFVIT